MKRLLPVLSLSLCCLSAPALDWPQWRGPDRTDLSKETGLLKSWPEGGPKQLWVYKDAGIGYGGPAIVGGKLYSLGLREEQEVVFCLDANTGAEVWTQAIGKRFSNDWGDGPRGTPTVNAGAVYVIGANGNIVRLAAETGKIAWQKTMQDLGGSTPTWGYTESPLLVDDKLVVTPGGPKGTLAALDPASGEVKWQSKEFTDPCHYSSAIVAEHNGAKQVIQLVEKNAVGVDVASGKVLWTHPWPGRVAVIPTPIFNAGRVFLTTGYGVGGGLFEIGAGNKVKELWMNKNMKNHHGGVILLEGHLYGYSDEVGWVCMDFATGDIKWADKKALGKGAIGYADGMFICVDEKSGEVALIKATPDARHETGRFTLSPQTTLRKPKGRIWTHPVVCNGRLYLRDQELLHCYDVAHR
jgi:outer membrane protein assembly factor BamB